MTEREQKREGLCRCFPLPPAGPAVDVDTTHIRVPRQRQKDVLSCRLANCKPTREKPELVQATEKKLGTGAVNQFLTNDHTLS